MFVQCRKKGFLDRQVQLYRRRFLTVLPCLTYIQQARRGRVSAASLATRISNSNLTFQLSLFRSRHFPALLIDNSDGYKYWIYNNYSTMQLRVRLFTDSPAMLAVLVGTALLTALVVPTGAQYCTVRGCCPGRDDECTVPIYDTLCYCDIFCNTTALDCCPDFWEFCIGIRPPTKLPLPIMKPTTDSTAISESLSRSYTPTIYLHHKCYINHPWFINLHHKCRECSLHFYVYIHTSAP